MCSYENERVKGQEACDFLRIVMHERSIDPVDYSGMKFRPLYGCKGILTIMGKTARFRYCAICGCTGYIAGYLHWTIETTRFLGPCLEDVKRICVMQIGAPEDKQSQYKSRMSILVCSRRLLTAMNFNGPPVLVHQ